MKKKITCLLCVVLIMGMLAACNDNTSVETTAAPVTEAEKEGSVSVGEKETKTPENEDQIRIKETVIYDNNGITVTVTGYEEGIFGPEITTLVTNNSEENIEIIGLDFSVNGYMTSTSSYYCEVAAGKKAIESIYLDQTDLDIAGIRNVCVVEFMMSLNNSDTYDEIDRTALISLVTNAEMEKPAPYDGTLIYEYEDIRVYCSGLQKDEFWDGVVMFYIENDSNETITVYTEDVSLNGFMISDMLWTTLRGNTKGHQSMYLMELENCGIESWEDIETMEFAIHLSDNDWNDIDVSDPITLNFD